MPSIAWFPLAILLFGLDEQAILFVVVLGAAPSIANGVISGIDHVPPAYCGWARVLGARARSPLPRTSCCRRRCPAYVVGPDPGLGVRLAQPDGR